MLATEQTLKKIKRFIFYWEFYDVTDKKPKICESIRAKPAGNILNRNNFRNRASAKKVTLVICVIADAEIFYAHNILYHV